MNNVDIRLLKEIADLEGTPKGAYNIRKNGQLDARKTTANIDIVTKEDKPGIDIHIKPGTKHQSVHIPAAASTTRGPRPPSTTASTPSMWAKTPRSTM